VIDKTQADTVIVTPTDQTVIIGGLISNQKTDTENKVPILGDIPLLGAAFKHRVTGTQKSELLIFLTPHVVNSPADLAAVTTTEHGKLDLAAKTIKPEDLKEFVPPPAK
jgi:general secretion pathway protein D